MYDCNTDSKGVKPKTFKEQTSDYIDALNQFLEEEQLDIPNEHKLEEVMTTLTEVLEHLY
jgi:predicted house-cleaning noncanonical NTP pyrophosphatase (MazG superfamily)